MQFKKTLLATTALMSAAAWAPQAHAIPAFARQVGMPCSACHYQHFPTLNSFGRAFKAAGFTMVGSEEKIEGDGLSIPAVLNLAFVTNLAYTKNNATTPAANPVSKTAANGQFQMTQYSMFMGGRVGEHIGFEGELGFAPQAGGLASVKLPFSYDVGPGKLDIVPFTTAGLGAAQGFEALSTGATPVHLFNQQDMASISAQSYLGTGTSAYGAALVYYTDMGYVNYTKFAADVINGTGAGAPGTAGGGSPTANYLRLVWTPGDVGGFDTAVGAQFWSGTSTSFGGFDGTAANQGTWQSKATAIDGQMMGDLSGMPLTLIASYATAPVVTASPGATATGGLRGNMFNQGTATKKSFNIGAELGVIPNKATLQLGIRRASAGVVIPGTAATSGTNASDNAIMVGATYNIALNVRAELTFSKYSGDMYNNAAGSNNAATGDKLTTINLWMGF